jgi:hypothetical protein
MRHVLARLLVVIAGLSGPGCASRIRDVIGAGSTATTQPETRVLAVVDVTGRHKFAKPLPIDVRAQTSPSNPALSADVRGAGVAGPSVFVIDVRGRRSPR